MNTTIPTILQARGDSPQERALWACWFAQGTNGRRGLPLVLVGEPGTAKTSRIAALASVAGLHFESVMASIRQPVDFLGMPMLSEMVLNSATQFLSPDGDAGIPITQYAAPGFALRAAIARRSLILFDEVNTCPLSVQAALLRVLFEGVCGEFQIPPSVRFVLAMNATEDSAGGWDIAPPLANRVGWIEWPSLGVDRFSSFLNGQLTDEFESLDCAAVEAAVDAAWPEAMSRAAALVTGFLAAQPGLLHVKPTDSGEIQRAWPSARTWDMACRAIAACEIHGLVGEDRRIAVSAFIGSAAQTQMAAWERSADLPNAAEVLDGVAVFTHKPERFDRTVAVLAACTGLVLTAAPRDKAAPLAADFQRRLDGLFALLDSMPDGAIDLTLQPARALVVRGLATKSARALKFLARVQPLLHSVVSTS